MVIPPLVVIKNDVIGFRKLLSSFALNDVFPTVGFPPMSSFDLQEFEKVPMFMKSIPEDFDPVEYPELACIQAILHDEDRSPEGEYRVVPSRCGHVTSASQHRVSSTEQVKCLKNEGNEFFKEKKYEKAVTCYTAALKKNCGDQEVNTVLLTNRAAAQFHLGVLLVCFM